MSARETLKGIFRWAGFALFNRSGKVNLWTTQEVVGDDEIVSMPSAGGSGGFGFAQMGDGEEWALFSFTSAGVVTLIANSANVVNTDTDANFCIIDNGSVVGFKNRLGSTKNLLVAVFYGGN